MASGPITAWQIEGEKVEVVTDFPLLGLRLQRGAGGASRTQAWGSGPAQPAARQEAPGTGSG